MLELKFETNYRDRLYKFTFKDMQSQMGYVAVDDKDHAMINAENPRIFVGVKDKNGKVIEYKIFGNDNNGNLLKDNNGNDFFIDSN